MRRGEVRVERGTGRILEQWHDDSVPRPIGSVGPGLGDRWEGLCDMCGNVYLAHLRREAVRLVVDCSHGVAPPD